MKTSDAQARPPRADSVRNRIRILEAAEEVFGEEGLGVPVDKVAERAGVGVGTLYRHFPTKETLCIAIVVRHFEGLLEQARSMGEAENPLDALSGFLESIIDTASAKKDLAEFLLGAGVDLKAAAGDLKIEMDCLVEGVFARAQDEGRIRPDVSYVDLMSLVSGACMSHTSQLGPMASSPSGMLAIILGGLTP